MMYMYWQVDGLSESFLDLNDKILEAEDRLAKLEREQEERKRLGFQ
jgi:hypothetical protein